MRIAAGIVGVLMFGVGMLVLVLSALNAVQIADSGGTTGPDWSCTTTPGSPVTGCDLAIGGVPRDHVTVTANVASTVAGGAVAICGAIFVHLGFSGSRRAAAAAAPAAVPAAVYAGAPGHLGPHRPPLASHPQHPAPPTGPQPTAGAPQPAQWPGSGSPSAGDPGAPGHRGPR